MNKESDAQAVFIQAFEKLLNEFDLITGEEREQAIALLKAKSSLSKRLRLATQGKCINCSNHARYNELAHAHVQKGDEWLSEKIAQWQSPAIIKIRPSAKSADEVTVNGLRASTILPYCCNDCQRSISESCKKVLESYFDRLERRSEYEQQKNAAVLAGKIRGTSGKVFYLLRDELKHKDPTDYLNSLSYSEFLKSVYWKTVRNYVREKRGYICELCASTERLEVHHKTYEHHGQEHNHLDDLILLCSVCHSRHHGKLYKGQGK